MGKWGVHKTGMAAWCTLLYLSPQYPFPLYQVTDLALKEEELLQLISTESLGEVERRDKGGEERSGSWGGVG